MSRRVCEVVDALERRTIGPVLALDKRGKVIIARKGGPENAARFITAPTDFPDHPSYARLDRGVSASSQKVERPDRRIALRASETGWRLRWLMRSDSFAFSLRL